MESLCPRAATAAKLLETWIDQTLIDTAQGRGARELCAVKTNKLLLSFRLLIQDGLSMHAAAQPSRHFFGLLALRLRWGLSPLGWVLVFVVIVGGCVGLLFTISPFLCVTEPVQAEILIVDGWLQEPAMRAAAQEFQRGGYLMAITVGGPFARSGGYVSSSREE